MSKKTLSILFGIFVVLAIAASSSWWGKYLNVGRRAVNADLNFSVITAATTDKISISKKGEEEKILEKKSGLWKINDFDASQKEIDDFFKSLSDLEIKSLASKNPENHKNFGVTEEDGVVISFYQSNAISTFILGKRGDSYNSFYAKKKGSQNVYLVFGSLIDKLSRNISAWRDKTVAAIQKETIQKIEIASKTYPLGIVKEGEKWTAKSSDKTKALDDTTINRLFAALNPLEATDFLNSEEQKEFKKKDKDVLRIIGNDNQKIFQMDLYRKDSDWWAQVEGREVYYKIASYKLSDIILSKDIFNEKKGE